MHYVSLIQRVISCNKGKYGNVCAFDYAQSLNCLGIIVSVVYIMLE